MKQPKSLTIAEKLKSIRESKGIMQPALAEAIDGTVSKISEIENGKRQYTDEEIGIIKRLLDVDDAPLDDEDVAKFKNRLYALRDFISDRRTDEADKLQIELAVIAKLPYEIELNALYELFKVRRLLINEGSDNIALSKNILEPMELSIEQATNEIKYHFYCNKGLLKILEGDNAQAAKLYSTAVSIEAVGFEKDPKVYYNLALCYSRMGMAVRSIIILMKSYNNFSNHDMTNTFRLHLDNLIAVNYIRTNQIESAIEVLNQVYERASSLNDKTFIGIALYNIGVAQYRLRGYEKAIEHFDRTFEYITKDDGLYLDVMYMKIRCLIVLVKATYKPLLLQAQTLAENNKHHSLLFESLEHTLSLKEKSSIKFIESKTIPYLIERRNYCEALRYCDTLINAFTKNDSKTKILETKALKAEILSKILYGGECG